MAGGFVERLLAMTPGSYTGHAAALAQRIAQPRT